MDRSYESSDEEEVDEAELEVALYSQVHFDPVTDYFAQSTRNFQPDFVEPSFQVGVRSFLSKKRKQKTAAKVAEKVINPPDLQLNFIGFSKDKVESESLDEVRLSSADFVKPSSPSSNNNLKKKDNTPDLRDSLNHDKQQSIDEQTTSKSDLVSLDNSGDDVILLDALAAVDSVERIRIQDNEDVEEDSVKRHVSKDPIFSKGTNRPTSLKKHNKSTDDDGFDDSDDDVILLNADFPVSNQQEEITKDISEADSHAASSQAEQDSEEAAFSQCLPFSITRKRDNTAPAEQEESVGLAELQEKEADEVQEPIPLKKKGKNKPRESKQPLAKPIEKGPEFLKLSSNVGNSSGDDSVIRFTKKKISKQEAAIKPRKPPVQLRRPPAVAVKYHLDSDTDTDYSDSEESSTFSPAKVSKKSAAKTQLKTQKVSKKAKKGAPAGDNLVALLDRSITAPNDMKGKQSAQEKASQPPASQSKVIVEYEKDSTLTKDDTSDENDESMSKEEGKSSSDSDSDADSPSNQVKRLESEKSSSSEESSDSGDDELEKEDVPIFNSGLDLNVAKMMSAQNNVPLKDKDGKWTIDEMDKLGCSSSPAISNRYFNPKSVTCRNCKKEGHFAIACTEKNMTVCILCGVQGHYYTKCPNSICYNCNSPGHKNSDCTEPRQNWREECARCWMKGHNSRVCPDLWRQYHLSVNLDSCEIVKSTSKPSKKVYCFNCGQQGHLGFECRRERPNRFVQPFYPFIAEYDDTDPGREEKRSSSKKKKKKDKKDRKDSRNTGSNSRDESFSDESTRYLLNNNQQSPKKLHHSHDKEERSWSGGKSFVSGNTLFSFQEPSDSKYSRRQPHSQSFQPSGDYYDNFFPTSEENSSKSGVIPSDFENRGSSKKKKGQKRKRENVDVHAEINHEDMSEENLERELKKKKKLLQHWDDEEGPRKKKRYNHNQNKRQHPHPPPHASNWDHQASHSGSYRPKSYKQHHHGHGSRYRQQQERGYNHNYW